MDCLSFPNKKNILIILRATSRWTLISKLKYWRESLISKLYKLRKAYISAKSKIKKDMALDSWSLKEKYLRVLMTEMLKCLGMRETLTDFIEVSS